MGSRKRNTRNGAQNTEKDRHKRQATNQQEPAAQNPQEGSKVRSVGRVEVTSAPLRVGSISVSSEDVEVERQGRADMGRDRRAGESGCGGRCGEEGGVGVGRNRRVVKILRKYEKEKVE